MRGLQKPKFGVLIFVLALFLTGSSAASAATILWGTTGSGGSVSTLVELDPDDGTLIRTIGIIGYTVNGLTWDPVSGKLYGSTSVTDPIYNGLIEIDPVTGAGTPIGVDGWGFGSPSAVTNITINSTGGMFGWLDPDDDDLVSIDPASGVATVVGDSGLSTGQYGLAFDPGDVLWLVNAGGDLYIIDIGDGSATSYGSFRATGHHGDWHPETGFYWGIDTAGSGPKNINVGVPDDGSYMDSFPTVADLHTITFGDTGVPEPGTLAMFGIGLAGLAIGRWRRAY